MAANGSEAFLEGVTISPEEAKQARRARRQRARYKKTDDVKVDTCRTEGCPNKWVRKPGPGRPRTLCETCSPAHQKRTREKLNNAYAEDPRLQMRRGVIPTEQSPFAGRTWLYAKNKQPGSYDRLADKGMIDQRKDTYVSGSDSRKSAQDHAPDVVSRVDRERREKERRIRKAGPEWR